MITDGQHRAIELDVPHLVSVPPPPWMPDLPPGEAPEIMECGEPLVDLAPSGICCLDSYARAGLPGTPSSTKVRREIVDRLGHAQALLPEGYRLAVFDGWRSLETQRALFERFYGPGSTLPPGYVADPDDEVVPPPHSTGAALDLTLAWSGQPLALGTYFDEFTPRAATEALETVEHNDGSRSDELDANLRRLLHSVLRAAGFAGLSSEWWHVSYGDQQWAYQYRKTHAIYGPVDQAK